MWLTQVTVSEQIITVIVSTKNWQWLTRTEILLAMAAKKGH